MPETLEFDIDAAHKHFAAHCFNRVWDLIEKSERTAEEDQMMVQLTLASLFHWSQRPDNDDRRRSIGYWQASRVHAILGHTSEALRYAELCLVYSHALGAFYLGYAYEASARAAKLAGDTANFRKFLTAAEAQARSVSSKNDQTLLETDLKSLR